MILIKFQKTGDLSLVSFLDIRKAFVRTLTRAKVPLDLSQGFNPHALVYFADPDSLGINSNCDYCFISSDVEVEMLKREFNAKAPNGLQIIKATTIQDKIKFNKVFEQAQYELEFEVDLPQNFANELLQAKQMIVQKKSQGECREVDMRPFIYALEQKQNKLFATLAYGQTKLNPFLLANYCATLLNCDKHCVNITKLCVFNFSQTNKLTNIDEFLFEETNNIK